MAETKSRAEKAKAVPRDLAREAGRTSRTSRRDKEKQLTLMGLRKIGAPEDWLISCMVQETLHIHFIHTTLHFVRLILILQVLCHLVTLMYGLPGLSWSKATSTERAELFSGKMSVTLGELEEL